MTMPTLPADFDYLVVGSGAGGGPLAANLARKGHKVLLLEAGDDPGDRLTYQVPAFHGLATEDDTMKCDYFVQHYSDKNRASQDSKYDEQFEGVWYPRASTLGGCAAHNAMITVYPHNSDWDEMAEATEDPTWNSENMRTYFERLERCEYVERPRESDPDFTRHGFEGWLTTSKADPFLALRDHSLLREIATAALQTLLSQVRNPTALVSLLMSKVDIDADAALDLLGLLLKPEPDLLKLAGDLVQKKADFLRRLFDPNDWEFVKNSMEGLCVVPLAVTGQAGDGRSKGRRSSPREFIRATEQELKTDPQSNGKLEVWTKVLVTRVLFEDDDPSNTAIGVEYLRGNDAPPPRYKLPPAQVRANREVILCAGTFNTPQLLMLSGIGPKDDLERTFKDDRNFRVRVDLPGVGKNLQDRYEVGVISELEKPFPLLEGAAFTLPESGKADKSALKNDPALKEWNDAGTGLYATNGAVLGIILKSRRERPEPDLFLFGLPGYFKGYFQKYSQLLEKGKDHFTWAILKAHTRNRAGTVTLRSTDPQDRPRINFRYFGDGQEDDDAREDLDSLVEGVKFVRAMSRLNPSLKRTILPGRQEIVLGDTVSDEDIREFIRREAWGHHACGTCRMGPKTPDGMVPPGDSGAVVDSAFRVYGTRNLRVVDASVFPHIPGFFIVTPIYMISEKASDGIDQDARRADGPPAVKPKG